MTYETPTQGMPSTCSQDGCVVVDTKQHDEFHKWLTERTESKSEVDRLRAELARAGEAAQGWAERCSAAVRVAEAARNFHGAGQPTVGGQPVLTGHHYRANRTEYFEALALWERLREDG